MRTRLYFVVLLLVILPTAILSIVAGRGFRNWGLVVQRRLQIGAEDSIRLVSRHVEERMNEELLKVQSVVVENLEADDPAADIEDAATLLCSTRSLVGQVYLFMNPWGFLYPPEYRSGPFASQDETVGTSDDTAQSLLRTLRHEISLVPSVTQPIAFTVSDNSYYFIFLRESKSLCAGFRVDTDALNIFLAELLSDVSGQGINLIAESPDAAGGGDVILRDSLQSGTTVLGRERDGSRGKGLLAEGRLRKPLDYIRIKATMENPGELERAGRLQGHLYTWGVLLLSCGILFGVWLVTWNAAGEIRRARARSDFVIGISHDLRTPISSLKMLSESLYQGHVRDPDQRKKFLAVMVRESERLGQMVERVLLFIRHAHASVSYSFEVTDLEELARMTIRVFEESVSRPVDVRIRKTGHPPLVKIDRDAINKVLFNLLDNALKYSDHRVGASGERGQSPPENAPGEKVRIDVSIGKEEKRRALWRSRRVFGVVSVRDYGAGVRDSERRRIFQRYYRASVERHGSVGGIGLGLSLANDIVKAHRGTLRVDQPEGSGAVFSICLPGAEKS